MSVYAFVHIIKLSDNTLANLSISRDSPETHAQLLKLKTTAAQIFCPGDIQRLLVPGYQ